MYLSELKTGESGRVKIVGGDGALRQHFLDMGLIPGVEVTLIKFAPMGDPLEVRLHGYELTLRLSEAGKILIIPEDDVRADDGVTKSTGQFSDTRSAGTVSAGKFSNRRSAGKFPHPGFGEDGKYHDKKNEHPLPDDTMITFALAGNQNSGKTTLFNQLTGANQHVGNFPGVTVDKKTGAIRGHALTEVTDLPGIYSMSPYSAEEVVSRQFILGEKPKGIIDIVDATNIERNLYLTLQLLELDVPMVVALNMMDEMQGNGGYVHINEMEEALGVPVVPISAAKNEGIDELIRHAMHVAKYQERPEARDICSSDSRGGAVHRAIHGVMALIGDHAEKAGIPVRFAATKVLEGDSMVIDSLSLDENEREMIEHIAVQMESESGLDRSAAIAAMRFDYIERVVSDTVVKPRVSKEHLRSQNIDRLLTGRYTAIPCFIGIMAMVFFLTFNVIGAFLQNALALGIEKLGILADSLMKSGGAGRGVRSLVTDGIFGGVGSVLSFLPIIVVLFFFLSLLEDTGYMARIAFVMDKLLRKIGLSGRSVVPMLIGFGCSVPAVMSTRTLPSARDRKMTIMLTPFMSCSAKLPIYAFFSAAFFPGHGALVMVALYFTGIIVGIITALIGKNTVFKGDAVPFVMELPNYRLPSLKSVARLLWEKSRDFLQKAFTVIFVATLVIWFLQHFTLAFRFTSDSSLSLLALVSGFIAPVFKPLGFGDWRLVSALISGFMAKESVVSTLNILMSAETLHEILTPVKALSYLVFCLLYTPCVAAIASIRRELGRKWSISVVIFQCLLAWLCSFIFYSIAVVV